MPESGSRFRAIVGDDLWDRQRRLESERNEPKDLDIEVDAVQDEKQHGVADNQNRRHLEERRELRPLPKIARTRRDVISPIARTVEYADVQETVLGDDHQDGLDEEVGLEVFAEPIEQASDIGNDEDPGDVDAEPARVVLLADRDELMRKQRRNGHQAPVERKSTRESRGKHLICVG